MQSSVETKMKARCVISVTLSLAATIAAIIILRSRRAICLGYVVLSLNWLLTGMIIAIYQCYRMERTK